MLLVIGWDKDNGKSKDDKDKDKPEEPARDPSKN